MEALLEKVWKDLGSKWGHAVVMYQFNDVFKGTTALKEAPANMRDDVLNVTERHGKAPAG